MSPLPRPLALSQAILARNLFAKAPLYIRSQLMRTHTQRPCTTSTTSSSEPPVTIFTLVKDARPAVRYTVYTAFGVIATAECSFWIKVIHSKFFAKEEDQFAAAAWQKFGSVSKVWIPHYRSWFEKGIWGW